MKISNLGIMQPYFIPYWGYFSHIKQCDFWVVFDQPKYSRKTWVNRNYILNAEGTPQLVSVPVTFDNNNKKTIEHAVIQKEAMCVKWLIKKLTHYKKSPYYDEVVKIINQAYSLLKSDKLCEFNIKLVSAICNYLGIEFKYMYSSEIDYDLDQVEKSGDWAFEISKALSAKTYINPISGFPIFEISKFRHVGIELQFLQTRGFPFTRNDITEIQHFSIIDTIFNCCPEMINNVLTNNIDFLSWEEASYLLDFKPNQ
jgi:hypothetical protein